MKSISTIVYRKFYKSNIIKLYGIATLLPLVFSISIVILTILFPAVFNFNDDDDIMVKINDNPLVYLLSIIILAPFFETLIQYIPVKISTLLYSPKYKYISCFSIVLSALIFATLHGKELIVSIPLFFAGFVWAFICLILIRKKSAAYLVIILTHASYNIIILCLDYIFY